MGVVRPTLRNDDLSPEGQEARSRTPFMDFSPCPEQEAWEFPRIRGFLNRGNKGTYRAYYHYLGFGGSFGV